MTGGGYLFLGIIIGLAAGFAWGAVRERKGKNKR